MRGTRWILWALALATSFSNACNYDEGQCWLRSEDDGQGAGVGGGPIGPVGAGGFGDVPPEPQDATDPPPDCDPDDATELGAVSCGRPAWGPDCMMLCAQSGVSCPAGQKHTVTKKLVLLYKCCACKGQKQCWYTDENDTGKVCVYRPETGSLTCK